MRFYFNPIIVITWLSTGLSLAMLLYFLGISRKSVLIYSFISLVCLAFLWSVGKLLESFAINMQVKWLSFHFMYIGIDFCGVAWLIFCLLYMNHPLVKQPLSVLLLLVPSVILHALFLTNHYHHTFFKVLTLHEFVPGLFFQITVLLICVDVVIVIIMLWNYAARQNQYVKRQIKLLVIALLLPFLMGFLVALNLVFFKKTLPFRDLAAPTFTVTIILFAIAIFKYKFLNIISIAFRSIVHQLKESIILVDNANIIIDYNFSFPNIFPECQQLKVYQNIEDFVEILRHKQSAGNAGAETPEIINAIADSTVTNARGEINIGPQYFFVEIKPIITDQQIIGRIISLNDITDYKRTLEELTIVKERNRLAREIHDSLGHTLILLLNSLENGKMWRRERPGEIEQKLDEAIQITRDGLAELRCSIQGLASEKLNSHDLIPALQYLISEFRFSSMKIDFMIEGKDRECSLPCSNVIYRACQEALTNSLRHGHATDVNIILRFTDGLIKLYVIDNGVGCCNLKKGFGLSGMEQRVAALKGKFIYGSNGEKGFNLYLEIPHEK